MVVLGKIYKEKVSGFEGVATGKTEYLWGCVRILVTAEKLDKEGNVKELWFDEPQLELVGKKIVKRAATTSTGGPRRSSPCR